MRLAELLEALGPAALARLPAAQLETPIGGVAFDSRSVRRGVVFVARHGTRADGHAFVAAAAEAGAAAIVGSLPLRPEVDALLRQRAIPYLRVPEPAQALGLIAAQLAGNPASALALVGVTGTNGKTTVTTLLYQLFSQLGYRCGLIGTAGIRIAGERLPATHTTPDPVALQRLLARMVRAGCSHCFLEVTSHAIDQRRTAGVEFAGGIFTTLGHDHLDYHGTIEAYARVKQRFFTQLPAGAFALANADDPRARFMIAHSRAQTSFYGSRPGTALPWSLEHCDEHGMTVRLGPERVRSRLIGEPSASNLAAAATATLLLGEELARVLAVVPTLRGARGRMQPVVAGPVLGLVDYAHTPEAVLLALATGRRLRPEGRLIAIAGCGGDRDAEKRTPIGAALATADAAVFTSDNPRSEQPQAIVAAMLAGVPAHRRSRIHVELDRRRALALAARLARPGDIVLALGKGHETGQQIGATSQPWDDAAELRAALLPSRQGELTAR